MIDSITYNDCNTVCTNFINGLFDLNTVGVNSANNSFESCSSERVYQINSMLIYIYIYIIILQCKLTVLHTMTSKILS